MKNYIKGNILHLVPQEALEECAEEIEKEISSLKEQRDIEKVILGVLSKYRTQDNATQMDRVAKEMSIKILQAKIREYNKN